MTSVDTCRLENCIELWVETFNDCACCPISHNCGQSKDYTSYQCAEKIINDYLEGGPVW